MFRWVGMPSPKEIVSPALSTSACEMMLVLRERLQCVEQLLAKPLFMLVWQRVAEVLNAFFYEQVILENSFNEGGAFQINFDITRNLFPLFGQYTQKPEAYFKDVKEACQVLTMNTGSALLLKDVLYCALHDPKSDPNVMPSDPIACLQEQGLYKLLPEQVEHLLRRRLDLS
ncbi:hypothetical protein LSH36_34g08179 [Paralvinella palmiformis]|uniref:Uncharacterized protein n=1 Tax=Paralvinella palmiformis TaxID=53620 RepID=A0AAD9K8Z5_9ANNE|nr:hypothetical protein LSH36_34g08179 [Paralvinella palmiformis]